jgi:6-phosphogluconate dehydrogenase
MKNMRIGFIGLGIMGRPMALNLVKAGFPLTVYNRTAAKCKPLIDAGAVSVSSTREVARSSDVVITIVSDTPDVESVLFGKEAVASGLREGQIVIDMSSISPSATETFAARLREVRKAPSKALSPSWLAAGERHSRNVFQFFKRWGERFCILAKTEQDRKLSS